MYVWIYYYFFYLFLDYLRKFCRDHVTFLLGYWDFSWGLDDKRFFGPENWLWIIMLLQIMEHWRIDRLSDQEFCNNRVTHQNILTVLSWVFFTVPVIAKPLTQSTGKNPSSLQEPIEYFEFPVILWMCV
jgi:hypothetical protein